MSLPTAHRPARSLEALWAVLVVTIGDLEPALVGQILLEPRQGLGLLHSRAAAGRKRRRAQRHTRQQAPPAAGGVCMALLCRGMRCT